MTNMEPRVIQLQQGVTAEQESYFQRLQERDSSPEMRRIINEAKESLRHEPGTQVVLGVSRVRGFRKD